MNLKPCPRCRESIARTALSCSCGWKSEPLDLGDRSQWREISKAMNALVGLLALAWFVWIIARQAR